MDDTARTAQEIKDDSERFEFGRNWQRFLDNYLTEERVQRAKLQSLEFMDCSSLERKSFLDIGCGSGLFSYIAHLSGADSIYSFDYDPHSVATTEQLRKRAGAPGVWRVLQGSVLSDEFMSQIPDCDIVYSWGVLHHTGDMWNAIRQAAAKVRPGGLFFIAIYNKQEYQAFKNWRGSNYWLKVKKFYNSGGWPARLLLEGFYRLRSIAGMLARGKNPLREIESYSTGRGMSWSVDITDWIGGLPFEVASVDEVFRFCRNEFGFELINLDSTISLGCNQFLFRNPENSQPD